MAKRTGFRQHAAPPAPGFHEYAEAATDWVYRYKFTLVLAAALLVGALVVWNRRGGGSASEDRAWRTFAEATSAAEEEQMLPSLKGTTAYGWAALRLGTYYYWEEKYADALRVLEPLATDEKAAEYPRGLALYTLGCTYMEVGDDAQAKKSFEKALTVNGKSHFLQELVARQEAALKDWPPREAGGGETTTQPPAAGGGPATVQPPAPGGGETTTERPAAGGETRSEAPTGEQ
jgi:tetratricopeptide (TPR) repeat protein